MHLKPQEEAMKPETPMKHQEPVNTLDRRSLLKSSAALLSPLLLPIPLRLLAAPGQAAEPSPSVPPGPASGQSASSAPGQPSDQASGQSTNNPVVNDLYPTTDPDLVREMVGVSHFSLQKVMELVETHATLAKASWDWGFGDWETALGAASHMGNKEIARFLLAKGAPPTIFSAAMLGHLDVVKAIVAANPGVEQVKGPHGIPLIAHAKAGGEPAAAVLAYLEPLGRPESEIVLKPLSDDEVKMLCGNYTFGKGARDRFEVTFVDDRLGVARTGGTRRFLFHRGDFEFYPSGAESVKLRFTVQGGKATAVTVFDPGPVLRAART
jgi:ankyrin repeat protein